jgi:glycosyltransferase involved in cell wall biosynthesis
MLVPELVRSRSRWVKNAWIALIEQRNVTAAAAIHATSDLEAHDLARFGWPLPQVAVIPNGVKEPPDATTQPVSPDVATAIERGDFVLSLGRIVWKKGLDRLIGALPATAATRLVLVGDDPEAHAAFLLREAARLGVADRVTILARHVEGTDKEALFAAARAFAMPSLSENFGIAAVEAMRRGAPVRPGHAAGGPERVPRHGSGGASLCQRALRLGVDRRKHGDIVRVDPVRTRLEARPSRRKLSSGRGAPGPLMSSCFLRRTWRRLRSGTRERA